MIYLDNHTATAPSVGILQHLTPFLKRHWKALSSPYLLEKEPFVSLNSSIKNLQEMFASPHFLICQDLEEATFKVYAHHYFETIYGSGKNHLLTTANEEAAICQAIGHLKKGDVAEHYLPLNETGQVDILAMQEMSTTRVGLLSISWVNGLTGVIQPLEEIVSFCNDRGLALHVDITHALGRLPLQGITEHIDYITVDGKRIHAPIGNALLMTKDSLGSIKEPFPFLAMAMAALEMEERSMHMAMEIARLRNKLEEGIVEQIPGAKSLFKEKQRLPNCCVISFPGVSAELLAFHLAKSGVMATFGGGPFQRLEFILQECGFDSLTAQSSLSFALSHETEEEEITAVIGHVVDIYQKCIKFRVEV